VAPADEFPRGLRDEKTLEDPGTLKKLLEICMSHVKNAGVF
jgi:hypothetical protein